MVIEAVRGQAQDLARRFATEEAALLPAFKASNSEYQGYAQRYRTRADLLGRDAHVPLKSPWAPVAIGLCIAAAMFCAFQLLAAWLPDVPLRAAAAVLSTAALGLLVALAARMVRQGPEAWRRGLGTALLLLVSGFYLWLGQEIGARESMLWSLLVVMTLPGALGLCVASAFDADAQLEQFHREMKRLEPQVTRLRQARATNLAQHVNSVRQIEANGRRIIRAYRDANCFARKAAGIPDPAFFDSEPSIDCGNLGLALTPTDD